MHHQAGDNKAREREGEESSNNKIFDEKCWDNETVAGWVTMQYGMRKVMSLAREDTDL